ncbi:CAP domain-containing protein [Pasteuria penetrans]|uniref:CAP domain-containing protein n=1 Tax=Pasteuria penetrans TaxID=86005 RepID=UPI000FB21805|nr:CAP domain-containing protein [Pasteuria penetrans]
MKWIRKKTFPHPILFITSLGALTLPALPLNAQPDQSTPSTDCQSQSCSNVPPSPDMGYREATTGNDKNHTNWGLQEGNKEWRSDLDPIEKPTYEEEEDSIPEMIGKESKKIIEKLKKFLEIESSEEKNITDTPTNNHIETNTDPSNHDTKTDGTASSQNVQAILDRINKFRRENGSDPVTLDPTYTKKANEKAKTIVKRGVDIGKLGPAVHNLPPSNSQPMGFPPSSECVGQDQDAGKTSLEKMLKERDPGPKGINHMTILKDRDAAKVGIGLIKDTSSNEWTTVIETNGNGSLP